MQAKRLASSFLTGSLLLQKNTKKFFQKKMVKLIRIAGTSFSGSTMLDLMLSNADNAFSCGEVNALFRPYRPHHFNPKCTCSDSNCTLWEKIKSHGEKNLWKSLSHLMPHVKIFVDSSKDLVWLLNQQSLDNKHDFLPLNVLIWKTPEEYAYSCFKRGRLKDWKRTYINYHTRYFNIMDRWKSVRYSDLACDPSGKLKKLCENLNISYFLGKEFYWNRRYHTLFGSDTAKMHLFDKMSADFTDIQRNSSKNKPMVNLNDEPEIKHHEKIHYEEDILEKLPPEILQEIENEPLLERICRVLEMTEIEASASTDDIQEVIQYIQKPTRGWNTAQKVKRYFQFLKCKLIMTR